MTLAKAQSRSCRTLQSWHALPSSLLSLAPTRLVQNRAVAWRRMTAAAYPSSASLPHPSSTRPGINGRHSCRVRFPRSSTLIYGILKRIDGVLLDNPEVKRIHPSSAPTAFGSCAEPGSVCRAPALPFETPASVNSSTTAVDDGDLGSRRFGSLEAHPRTATVASMSAGQALTPQIAISTPVTLIDVADGSKHASISDRDGDCRRLWCCRGFRATG